MRDTARGMWVTGLPDQADVIIIGQEYVVSGVPVAPTFQEPTQ
jgi:multidrug efflux system membrane fusion protein